MALRAVKMVERDEYLVYNEEHQLTHTMRRDPLRSQEWVLVSVDGSEIDSHKYRHDLFDKHKIAY